MPQPLVTHSFEPIVDDRSKVLMLGSFPSLVSEAKRFYYAHPRNQFWPIMESLFDVTLSDNAMRRKFAIEHGIAIWDVYGAIIRKSGNSSDANLTNMQLNDIPGLLQRHSNIVHVFCTGQKSYAGCQSGFDLQVPCVRLPSTSAAYASMTFEAKREAYRIVKEVLDASD